MVLNAYTPTSKKIPLLYIQNFNQKLTAILKKENLMKYKIILVAAIFLMAVLLKELKNTEK